MITVAATSNNTVVGEDNTALSKINKGLSDRYKIKLTNDNDDAGFKYTVVDTYPDSTKPEYQTQLTTFKSIYTKYDNTTYDLESVFNRTKTEEEGNIPPNTISPNLLLKAKPIGIFSTSLEKPKQQYLFAAYGLDSFLLPGSTSFFQYIYNMSLGIWDNIDNADSFRNKFQDINKKWNNIQGKGKNNPTFKSGFIPFNLSLTMDGLGGMKIYQKFSVDTNFLPSNYPASIEFLIKNIQHTVKDNKWITKIESFCVSKPGDDAKSASTPTVTSAKLGLTPKPTPTTTSAPTACGISTESSHPSGDYRGGITKWIGSISRSAKCNLNAITSDILYPSPLPNDTDSGNMGCAAAVSLIFYRATGYSITEKQPATKEWNNKIFPGDLGTLGLYTFFSKNPNLWAAYDLKDAKPGDIILTPRATKAGHVGVVIDTKNSNGTYNIISNSSNGFQGSSKGTIQQNYSIQSWNNTVTGRNPTQTKVWRYSGAFR